MTRQALGLVSKKVQAFTLAKIYDSRANYDCRGRIEN
jgi:hypothetical protein